MKPVIERDILTQIKTLSSGILHMPEKDRTLLGREFSHIIIILLQNPRIIFPWNRPTPFYRSRNGTKQLRIFSKILH